MSTANFNWKGILTCILLAIFIFFAISTLYQFLNVDSGMVLYSLDKEAQKLATTMFFNKMTSLAQLGIALLGGLWAFLSLADTKIEIKGWTTVLCFLLANFSFASSLIVYFFGYDFIVERIFHHATFDIDAPLVVLLNTTQQLFFVLGCLNLVATILLGRKES